MVTSSPLLHLRAKSPQLDVNMASSKNRKNIEISLLSNIRKLDQKPENLSWIPITTEFFTHLTSFLEKCVGFQTYCLLFLEVLVNSKYAHKANFKQCFDKTSAYENTIFCINKKLYEVQKIKDGDNS